VLDEVEELDGLEFEDEAEVECRAGDEVEVLDDDSSSVSKDESCVSIGSVEGSSQSASYWPT
jgi:hypothetical protein